LQAWRGRHLIKYQLAIHRVFVWLGFVHISRGKKFPITNSLAELFATSASSENFAMGKSLSDQRASASNEKPLRRRQRSPLRLQDMYPVPAPLHKSALCCWGKVPAAAHAVCSVPNDGKIAKDMSSENITSRDSQFNVPTYRNNKLVATQMSAKQVK